MHIVIAVSVWYSSNYDAVEEKNKQYAARLDSISFVAALLNVLYLADSAVIIAVTVFLWVKCYCA